MVPFYRCRQLGPLATKWWSWDPNPSRQPPTRHLPSGPELVGPAEGGLPEMATPWPPERVTVRLSGKGKLRLQMEIEELISWP